MNLPLKIARRYLFAKKSTNAINIISGISVFGITVGTAALILVLSVFNGFEDLITGLFSSFNPDVKITPAKGKTFDSDTLVLNKLRDLEGITYVAQSLEEVAYFGYKGSKDFGIVKGVDEFYKKVTRIDSTVREGKYLLSKNDQDLAVIGVGMRNKLSVDIENVYTPISVYMIKKKNPGPLGKPFKSMNVYPAGTFVIQQDFDNQYVLTSLEFAQKLIGRKNAISAIEIKLNKDINTDKTLESIKGIMGEGFVIKNRYRQDEAFLKLMNIEKWMSFIILSFTLILVAFNLIGSLWMIVLEKKKDIAILKSMGANNKLIRNIFLSEGLLLCGLGMILGFIAALILYWIQKAYGIVPIPPGFVVDAYPISMRLSDFTIVALTVIGIGLMASLPPAFRAARVNAMIREE